jgi:uncharacterized protein YggE
MRNLLAFLALSILSLPALTAERPLITVKGEATTELPPDFVKVGVVISALEKTIDSAKADVDARTRSLLAAIEPFGIEANDMAFSGVEVTRSYDYDRNENSRFVGYEVSRSLEVKVRDLNSYELLVEALARSGASEIDSPEADVDDRHRLKTLALKEATLNAKRKAEEIASGLGVRIGRPFEIGEDRLPSQMPFSQRRAHGNEIEEVVVTASRAGISDPIMFVPENIKVSATVWISFEIEDRQ